MKHKTLNLLIYFIIIFSFITANEWIKSENKALKKFFKEDSVKISFKYEQNQLDIKHDAIDRYGNTLSGIVKLMQRGGGVQSLYRKASTLI